MGGCAKTSTHDVTANAPQSPFSKLKTGTASVVTPKLSGSQLSLKIRLLIVMPCCSTFLAKGTSQTKEQAVRYRITLLKGLVLLEIISVIYVQLMNHLIMKLLEVAIHMQISLVIVSQLMKLVKTC
jgi:hypothetical protein